MNYKLYGNTHEKISKKEANRRDGKGTATAAATLINDKLLKFNRTSFHLLLSPRCVLLTGTNKRPSERTIIQN